MGFNLLVNFGNGIYSTNFKTFRVLFLVLGGGMTLIPNFQNLKNLSIQCFNVLLRKASLFCFFVVSSFRRNGFSTKLSKFEAISIQCFNVLGRKLA